MAIGGKRGAASPGYLKAYKQTEEIREYEKLYGKGGPSKMRGRVKARPAIRGQRG